MADSSILREYLIALGFDVKSDEYKKFSAALDNVTRGVTVLGTALAVGTAAVETFVKKSADHYSDLYYAGQRVGDSVANIQAFSAGAQQAGITVEQSTGAIENFARAVRLSPGLEGILKGFGIDTTEAKTEQLLDLVNKLRTLNPAVAAQYGSMFGIDPDTLLMMEQKLPQIVAGMDSFNKKQKDAGVDADALAAKSRDLENAWTKLDNDLGNLSARIEGDFLTATGHMLTWADEAVIKFNAVDKATKGWLSTLATGAVTVAGYFASKGILGAIFGGGAKAAAAEAAAKTAAASAGGSIARVEASGLGEATLGVLGPLSFLLGSTNSTQTQAQEDSDLAKYRASHPVRNAAGILIAPDSRQPLGIRSNNPGNLQPGGVEKTYATAEDGIAALAGNLLSYSKQGINTVTDIIKRWAPEFNKDGKKINDTPAYIADVARRLGVGAGDKLDLSSAAVLDRLTAAIIGHENGKNPYSMGMIDDAVRSRLFSGAGAGIGNARLGGGGNMTITIDAKTPITINGAGDPKGVADEVAKNQSRVYGDVVRDLGGALQ